MVIYTKVTIGGTEYKDVLDMRVKSSVSTNNAASNFKIQLENINGKHINDVNIGDQIIIYSEKDVNPPTTKILTGILEDIKPTGNGQDDALELSGRDYTARLQDRIIEPENYNDQTVTTIVLDIMSKYVDDVTTNNVAIITKNIDDISFSYDNVYDALRQLADSADALFWIDADNDLHFVSKGTTSSGKTFNNTNVTRSSFNTTDKEMVNAVWVYGDRTLTGYKTEFKQADTGSEFTLPYKPHNTNVVIGGSVTLRGGIFEMLSDNPSGTEYLIDYNNRNIIFTSGTEAGNNIPAIGASIVVDYDRSVPLIKYGEDIASIATHGRKQKVIVDKEIKNPDMAQLMVKQELAEFGSPRTEGTVYVHGIATLTAGQTCIVDLDDAGISTQVYDMIEVTYDFSKKNMLADQVIRVKVSKKIKDIVDTIKQLILDVKALQKQDSTQPDVLPRFIRNTGSVGVRQSGLVIYTRALTGSFLIYDSPSRGLYDTFQYADTASLGFIVGNPNFGILGTNGLGTNLGPKTIVYSGGYF